MNRQQNRGVGRETHHWLPQLPGKWAAEGRMVTLVERPTLPVLGAPQQWGRSHLGKETFVLGEVSLSSTEGLLGPVRANLDLCSGNVSKTG